ncbi:MAG: hypothetical protein A2089_11350 [Elusimicrobia bacterium GWD2_63_28]|nr:MAG: hypothetical protein A2089_11350 [Elusimicrobia bacterium GWD2_63_28]
MRQILKRISFENIWLWSRYICFYLLNQPKYKKLGYTALIVRPLRIVGQHYISVCRKVRVNSGVWLLAQKIDDNEPALIINEGCVLGDSNHIVAVRSVVLGKNVLTANNVYISDNLHSFDDVNTPIMFQPVRFKGAVNVGDGAWIGENVAIIGASVGKNSVVGANSVVTKNIPDYSIAVGSPARVIKQFNFQTKKWEKV